MTSSTIRFIRNSLLTISIPSVLLGGLAACDTSNSDTDPRPSCTPTDGGTGCVGPSGGGSNTSGGGSSGAGGEGGGTVGTNDVTGKVGVLSDPGFSTATAYAGASTVSTIDSSGTAIESPYGDTATTFTLTDVKPGSTWFFVQDNTVGATGIFSTHSILNVPTGGSVTLPVVDRNVITSIAATLPSPIVIDGSRGVLVLKVIRNGQPLAGVKLATTISGATLAYDTGVGLYSNQVMQTGPAGVILALNFDGPATAQLLDLTLTDVNQQSFIVQVKVQQGAATFAGFTL